MVDGRWNPIGAAPPFAAQMVGHAPPYHHWGRDARDIVRVWTLLKSDWPLGLNEATLNIHVPDESERTFTLIRVPRPARPRTEPSHVHFRPSREAQIR